MEDDLDALDSGTFQRRTLELRLIHHYITAVARTLPASVGEAGSKSEIVREVYIVDILQMAFAYPFLLNTIFAISALHKTLPQREETLSQTTVATTQQIPLPPPAKAPALSPAEVAEYARAHRIYLNTAIQQQRKALMELSAENADAVCLNSVFLSICALKILPEEENLPYEPPIRWLSMSQAIRAVVKASQPLLPENAAMRKIIENAEPDFSDEAAIFNEAFIDQFQAILEYPEQHLANKEDTQVYRRSVAYIGGMYQAIRNGEARRQVARRISSAAPVLPKHLVTLVEQKRPRALVIIAHLMSMCKYVDDYWFYQGIAEHEVSGIQSILPDEWQWAMEWPIKMLKTLAEPPFRHLQT